MKDFFGCLFGIVLFVVVIAFYVFAGAITVGVLNDLYESIF